MEGQIGEARRGSQGLAGSSLPAPEAGPSARAGLGPKRGSPSPRRPTFADEAWALAADAAPEGGVCALRVLPSRAPRETADGGSRRSLLYVEPVESWRDCVADETRRPPRRGSCGQGGPTPHPSRWAGDHRVRCPQSRSLRGGDSILPYPPPSAAGSLPPQHAAGEHRVRCPQSRSLRGGDSTLPLPPSVPVGSPPLSNAEGESHPNRPARPADWRRSSPRCGGGPSPSPPGSRPRWRGTRLPSIAEQLRGRRARGSAGRSVWVERSTAPLLPSWAP
jgi:hypothetical protein